ncbi:MAG: UDP-N-acetylglucosamine 2-epimerase (non-hydrolyzing) [Lachnospiraceae bacterium]|nr:UDP-N-acetylglucosamine 2-epimerase (non-hydrolyzing) [Lachnospiraceae bacterium]
MKKILVVFGTRPEAIKMCPLIIKIREQPNMECCVCLTGQHREMLLQVMDSFGIIEDYNLNVMKESQTLTFLTGRIISEFDKVLINEHPDLVLVHGDTTSSFAASLVAFYHGISIGHVEAGLRTYNIKLPFPEEFNRQAIDLIGDMYFAPTNSAKLNLIKEGKSSENIFVTGNTVIDALQYTVKKDFMDENLEWAKGYRLIMLTAHRRESIDEKLEGIFETVKKLLREFDDIKVIFPIHKNPKIRKLASIVFENVDSIRIIEPLDVIKFHNYMAKSYLILTDSGGIQEEAPSLGVPVLVLRDVTERPEGIEAGVVKLAGTSEEMVYKATKELLTNQAEYEKMRMAVNPYGDGKASEYIVDALKARLSKNR